MAEATTLRNNALPYPVYGAPWTVTFPIFDADGDLVTAAAALDSEVSKNGDTFTDCTNEATEIATSSGMYYLTLTGTEMTADVVVVIVKTTTTGAKTTPITIYPRKMVLMASGTSAGGATGYIDLASGALSYDDQYNGCLCVAVIDGTTEARVIDDSTDANDRCYVTPDWNTAPDADDTYSIYFTEGMQIPQVNTIKIGGSTQSPVVIPSASEIRAEMDSNSTQLAAIVEDTGTTLPTTLATIDGIVDDILLDTAEIGVAGAGLTEAGGTGDHLTALPWNASWDAEVQSEVEDGLTAYDAATGTDVTTAAANVSVDEIQVTALADLFNTDSGTTYGSAVAGSVVKEIADNAGGSALTEAGIADAVWDEALSGHTTAGTAGKALSDAGAAGDPWGTSLPGAYGAGTAGYILGTNVDATVSSRASSSDLAIVDGNVDLILEDTGTTIPDLIGNIASTGAPAYQAAASVTLNGSSEVNSYTDTDSANGVYHQIADNAGALNAMYEYTLRQDEVAVGFLFKGRMSGVSDNIAIQAYDWVGAAWETLYTLNGVATTTDTTISPALVGKYTGTTGTDVGKVRIRGYAASGLTSATWYVDQLIVAKANTSRTVGYSQGAIWLDSTHGTSGTTIFYNGTADNPVNTWADAISLATALDMRRFNVGPGTSITLSGDSSKYSIDGAGYTLDLNGQECSYLTVRNCEYVVGTGTTTTWEMFFWDTMIGDAGVTVGEADFNNCHLTGPVTFGTATEYLFHHCIGVPVASPGINFNSTNSIAVCGGAEGVWNITNMTQGTLYFHGDAQLIIASSCTGGTIHISGNVELTNNGSGQTITYGATTLSSAANAAISDSVWDELLADHLDSGSTGKRLKNIAEDLIIDGTAVGATGNTITLDASASSSDGAYDPAEISIIAGTGAGQSRLILQYVGSTKVATVDRDWKVNPSTDSEYVVVTSAGREHVNEGLAQSGTSTTITLNALASSANDAYKGQIIFIRSGGGADQARRVGSYNGTTKVATVTRAWAVTPDSTSAYSMLPTGALSYECIREAIGMAAADLDAQLDAIVEDTGTTIPSQISGLNNISAADVNAEVDTALADYDGPTKAELDAAVAPLATSAALGLVASDVSDVLLDTNELQTDWVDGGRLDNLLDGAATAGDPWTTSLPGAYGAGTAGYILGTNLDEQISGLNDLSAADVNAEVDSAIADAFLATAAALADTDAKVDSILEDTATTIPAAIANLPDAATIAGEVDTQLSTTHGSGAWTVDNTGVGNVDCTLYIVDIHGNLVADADVWVTSDLDGDTVVAGPDDSNDNGAVTFRLNSGVTYYCWRRKAGVNFTNPVSFVAKGNDEEGGGEIVPPPSTDWDTVNGIYGGDQVTLTIVDDLGDPVEECATWISSDSAGTDRVAGPKNTNINGMVTFWLIDGATYYCWRTKGGVVFTNPLEFVAVED